MGRDEPQVLQATSSHPLKEGHPTHAGGNGGGEGEEEGGEEGGGKGDWKGGEWKGAGGSGGREGKGEAGSGGGGGLERQVASMQRQLAEQGALLHRMAAQLAAVAPEPASAEVADE